MRYKRAILQYLAAHPPRVHMQQLAAAVPPPLGLPAEVAHTVTGQGFHCVVRRWNDAPGRLPPTNACWTCPAGRAWPARGAVPVLSGYYMAAERQPQLLPGWHRHCRALPIPARDRRAAPARLLPRLPERQRRRGLPRPGALPAVTRARPHIHVSSAEQLQAQAPWRVAAAAAVGSAAASGAAGLGRQPCRQMCTALRAMFFSALLLHWYEHGCDGQMGRTHRLKG